MICEPTTKRYLFGLVGISKVRHCLHSEFSKRVLEGPCEDPTPKRVSRMKCCHCEYASPWWSN